VACHREVMTINQSSSIVINRHQSSSIVINRHQSSSIASGVLRAADLRRRALEAQSEPGRLASDRNLPVAPEADNSAKHDGSKRFHTHWFEQRALV
jgi:hypothetical protein